MSGVWDLVRLDGLPWARLFLACVLALRTGSQEHSAAAGDWNAVITMKAERCDMAWRRTHGRAAHTVSISFAPSAEGARWPDPNAAYSLGTLAGFLMACRDPALPSWRGKRKSYFKYTSPEGGRPGVQRCTAQWWSCMRQGSVAVEWHIYGDFSLGGKAQNASRHSWRPSL